jgi:hypothetical protein
MPMTLVAVLLSPILLTYTQNYAAISIDIFIFDQILKEEPGGVMLLFM